MKGDKRSLCCGFAERQGLHLAFTDLWPWHNGRFSCAQPMKNLTTRGEQTMKNLTTREVSERCDAPDWLVRRVVDAIDPPFDRFGPYRIIPENRLAEVKKAIKKRRSGQSLM